MFSSPNKMRTTSPLSVAAVRWRAGRAFRALRCRELRRALGGRQEGVLVTDAGAAVHTGDGGAQGHPAHGGHLWTQEPLLCPVHLDAGSFQDGPGPRLGAHGGQRPPDSRVSPQKLAPLLRAVGGRRDRRRQKEMEAPGGAEVAWGAGQSSGETRRKESCFQNSLQTELEACVAVVTVDCFVNVETPLGAPPPPPTPPSPPPPH